MEKAQMDKIDELRFREHNVKLNNQQIIEFAYLTMQMIEPCIEEKIKLSFERANCYLACFYHVRELLKIIDSEYLTLSQHSQVANYYMKERELSNDGDMLDWYNPKEEVQDDTHF